MSKNKHKPAFECLQAWVKAHKEKYPKKIRIEDLDGRGIKIIDKSQRSY
jgi:hypothetical protein